MNYIAYNWDFGKVVKYMKFSFIPGTWCCCILFPALRLKIKHAGKMLEGLSTGGMDRSGENVGVSAGYFIPAHVRK